MGLADSYVRFRALMLQVDSCAARAADRGIVALIFPAFYTGGQNAEAQRADTLFGASSNSKTVTNR